MSGPEHYFSPDPSVPSAPREVRYRADGHEYRLTTDRGVFSHGEVDKATALLLATAPAPSVPGPLLDLGCGYGVIAAVWARREPERALWGVDVNQRALALARANTAEYGERVTLCTPEKVPEGVRFAAIYSNPPIKVGKSALHELLERWLARLAPGGAAYLVVSKHLGSDSLAAWLGESGYRVRRLASKAGNRILEVRST